MQTRSIGGGRGEDLMTKLSLDYQHSYHYISLAKNSNSCSQKKNVSFVPPSPMQY